MKNFLKVAGLGFSLLLVFCIPLAHAASCNDWSDINSGTELCTAATYAYNRNIMYGYGSDFGAFKPGSHTEQFVNRAEAMAIILRALDADYFKTIDVGNPPSASSFSFTDLPAGGTQWWYGYLRRMLDLGGVRGYADGTFRGGNRVTRAEFVKMFLNLTPYKNQVLSTDPYGQNPYGDDLLTGDMAYKKNAWYAPYIAYLELNAPLPEAFQNNRCPAPNYCPDYEITRDEAALFLYYYHQWSGQDLGTSNPNPTPPPPPPTTLGTPVLYFPNNNMTYYGSNPTVNFSWYSTKGAVKYDLMIKYGSNPDYAVYQTVNPNYTIPSSYFPSLALSPSGYLHRWKVRAYDVNGNWQDSEERYIYVYNNNNNALSAPVLSSPISGSNVTFAQNMNMTFNWNAVSGAQNYDLMIRNGNSGNYSVYTTSNNSYSMAVNTFPVSAFPYYWKVRAYDNNGNMKDSTEWYFYVTNQQISGPTLVSPNNNQTYNGNQNFTFTWNLVNGATRYDFMILYANSSSYTVYTVGSGTNQYYLPASAFPSVSNTTYTHYWKVRAYDANNNWKESEVRALTITPPAVLIPIVPVP